MQNKFNVGDAVFYVYWDYQASTKFKKPIFLVEESKITHYRLAACRTANIKDFQLKTKFANQYMVDGCAFWITEENIFLDKESAIKYRDSFKVIELEDGAVDSCA